MNCEQACDLAALAASGDLTTAEQRALELHVAGCSECRSEAIAFDELRAELAGMRTESAPEHVYAAVRARVAGEIVNSRRPGWLTAWPAFVAVLACSVMLVVLLRPEGSVSTPQAAPHVPETLPAIAGMQYELPEVPAPPLPRRVRRAAEPAVSQEPDQPVVVHMFTDDPDVVIYWIADAKRPRTKKESMQ